MTDFSLAPSSSKYAEVAFSWRTQQSTIRHNPVKNMSLEEVMDQLSKEGSDLSNLHSHEVYRWIAFANGLPVGNVNLKQINHMMMYAEIGYGVGEEFQSKGYGTQMVKCLVEKVFKETQLRKLFAFVHDKNIPSCKLLERIGFKKEGLLREHYIINGSPENEVFYGLLRSDYEL